ncbi:MAG: hypothetical protein OIF35_04225, partial [Cellvibrionaceae bacterium]|nr:hypothetical protein [Cellvibrionaceae bacterium]
MAVKHLLPLLIAGQMAAVANAESKDPFIWLEEVEGDKPMAWVKQQNQRSLGDIKAFAGFEQLVENSLAILNNKDRIPYVSRNGDYYYNFWKDADNPRGLYRRTPLSEYHKPEPKWETVLDIDALGKAEGVNWVYKGMRCLQPKYEQCM